MSSQTHSITNWPRIKYFIDRDLPVQIPFEGTPWCSVAFVPQRGELSLFLETTEGLGDDVPPSDINIEYTQLLARKGIVVSTNRRDLYFHFYCFLCAMVDSIHHNGATPSESFRSAILSFRDLIERESVLSEEKQLGLMAELLVFEQLGQHKDWKWCLDAWHNQSNAEHDFNLGNTDLEVKATLMETRTHVIGSLRQLEPSTNRALYLVSFQFTQNQHPNALTLCGIVERIRNCISEKNGLLEMRFMDRLHSVGFREEHTRFYHTGVSYRQPELVFLVDSQFPRLVPSTLHFAVDDHRSRISQVTYRTNLDHLAGESLSAHLQRITGTKHD